MSSEIILFVEGGSPFDGVTILSDLACQQDIEIHELNNQTNPRGKAQWIKYLPVKHAAMVRIRIQLKIFSAVPRHMHSLTHNACRHMLQQEYLSWGKLKEDCGKILVVPSVR